jgi:hypothetical protein
MSERTAFGWGSWIEGQADAAEEVAPEPVEADGQTWPSQWHRDRYIADVQREVETARRWLANPRLSKEQRAEYEGQQDAALAELKRLDG